MQCRVLDGVTGVNVDRGHTLVFFSREDDGVAHVLYDWDSGADIIDSHPIGRDEMQAQVTRRNNMCPTDVPSMVVGPTGVRLHARLSGESVFLPFEVNGTEVRFGAAGVTWAATEFMVGVAYGGYGYAFTIPHAGDTDAIRITSCETLATREDNGYIRWKTRSSLTRSQSAFLEWCTSAIARGRPSIIVADGE